MGIFHVASEDEIKQAATTDIYFARTKEILKAKSKDKVSVIAEITSGRLPENWDWGLLCGIEEVARLFEGIPVDVYSMPEGSAFRCVDSQGFRVPVVRIEGVYNKFCQYETPILGLICQASGIATRAARIRKLAENSKLVSFGVRRMHPSLSPMIDRAAFIGGFDAVSSLLGAKLTETKPMGTMPHSLMVIFGDQVAAWKAFDEVIGGEVPRVALVDTYSDEKVEAVMAARTLKNLQAVRLDTPSSRRGCFTDIIREVRWELTARGFDKVEIFVSGGLNEESIINLRKAGVDAFGVGTYVSNSPAINFALDIVEINGDLCAKRGKLGGKKEVWRCKKCMIDQVRLYKEQQPKCPKCHGETERMLEPLVKKGTILADLPKPKDIRRYVLKQLKMVSLD
jgi:nicotinate phosphoribosyltransferase